MTTPIARPHGDPFPLALTRANQGCDNRQLQDDQRSLCYGMRYLFVSILFLLVSCSKPDPVPLSAGGDMIYRLVRVIEGDTLEVKGVNVLTKVTLTVRLAGIDCPKPDQPYGKEAAEYFAKFVGERIKLEKKGTDTYRTLAHVELPDGRDMATELVKAGLAWTADTRGRPQGDSGGSEANNTGKLVECSKEAQAAKRGLWADPNPIPPKEWQSRRGKGKNTAKAR